LYITILNEPTKSKCSVCDKKFKVKGKIFTDTGLEFCGRCIIDLFKYCRLVK